MRFQNLTITLTLACLSIVAIVGLVLLPMIGICGWTTHSSTYKSFSDDYKDGNGIGWSLSASVNAYESNGKGSASASANPNIVNPEFLLGVWASDKNQTVRVFDGNATVKALVIPSTASSDPSVYTDTPYPDTALVAAVQIVEIKFKICLLERTDTSETMTKSFQVGAAGNLLGVTVGGGGELTWTDTQGNTWQVEVTGERSEHKAEGMTPTSKSASYTGGTDWAVAGASVEGFNMSPRSFSSESVTLLNGSY